MNRSLLIVVFGLSGVLVLGALSWRCNAGSSVAPAVPSPQSGSAPPIIASRRDAAPTATPLSPELERLRARRVLFEKVDALLQVSDFKLARHLLDEDQARYGDDLTPPWPDRRQSYRLIADCLERPGDPKPRVFAQAFVEVSEAAALVPKVRAACAAVQ